MAGMRVDRTLRQAVYGRSLGECFNQVREDLLGPTIMVALSPVGSDERSKQPPGLRRPGDIGFVDIPAPGGCVVATRGEAEAEREHGLTSCM